MRNSQDTNTPSQSDLPIQPKGMVQIFSVYTNRKILWIFVNGIASGFPWVVIGSTMTLWLKEEGLSRTAIGFFGSIFVAYTCNFLWAPLVDGVKLPWLSKLGRRRSWIVFAQIVLLFAIVALSYTNPSVSIVWTSLLAMLVAIAGATQDISIDAYRIDILADEDSTLQAAGAAAATSGWWTGYSLLGAAALYIADFDSVVWADVYLVLAAFVVLLIVFTCAIGEPRVSQAIVGTKIRSGDFSVFASFLCKVHALAVAPLKDFFVRYGLVAIALLLFVFLFKLGEAFLGRMSLVFYSELGFDKTQIATYSKVVTWWVTILFSVISGGFVIRFGLVKGLFVGGVTMAATNLLFALMVVVGPQEWVFLLTVILDGFTSAFSTVAFVAFISYLTSTTFSATQYALMASIGNFGRTLFASSSGAIVDGLGGNWVIFFIFTALMVIPSLLLLVYCAKKLDLWSVRLQ